MFLQPCYNFIFSRYHLEEDQMYSHLSPGKISDNLRKALGLHRNELPPYIYRMRMLGYPPGWIKEAEEDASNLCMFDIEGKTVSNHKRKNCSIDPEKVVAYPGFNAPMEKGVHDVGFWTNSLIILYNNFIINRIIDIMVFHLFLLGMTNR